jgi:hypothetical protein
MPAILKRRKKTGAYFRVDGFNQKSQVHPEAIPCFNFRSCKGMSVACKSGRSLCQACLDKLPGLVMYPLRTPKQGEILRIEYALNMKAASPAV